jgi:hypothetical protein
VKRQTLALAFFFVKKLYWIFMNTLSVGLNPVASGMMRASNRPA